MIIENGRVYFTDDGEARVLGRSEGAPVGEVPLEDLMLSVIDHPIVPTEPVTGSMWAYGIRHTVYNWRRFRWNRYELRRRVILAAADAILGDSSPNSNN